MSPTLLLPIVWCKCEVLPRYGAAAATKKRPTFALFLILIFINMCRIIVGSEAWSKISVLVLFDLAALWPRLLANPPAKSASFDLIRGNHSPKTTSWRLVRLDYPGPSLICLQKPKPSFGAR